MSRLRKDTREKADRPIRTKMHAEVYRTQERIHQQIAIDRQNRLGRAGIQSALRPNYEMVGKGQHIRTGWSLEVQDVEKGGNRRCLGN